MNDATKPTTDDAADTSEPVEAERPAELEAAKPTEKKAEPSKPKKKKAKAPELENDSPDGQSLKEAETAFEIGDYQTTRALATKLAASTQPVIADRARDLLRRTDVDPVQMVFLAACACALIGVAFYYLR